MSRIAFAAAHVVPGPAGLDWDATLRFRHHLWSLGLGVAEAMDTAQRGMGLDWPLAKQLITKSGADAAAVGGRLACGAATDQLPPGDVSLDGIVAAYTEQMEHIESCGAQPVLMASRALSAAARHADDYLDVYGKLLSATRQPVILHWLGEMFDPALRGYWGSTDLDRATETLLELIRANATKIDGIKVSLLDADREIAIRRALPAGVRLYTGDDYNYPQLIAGDEYGHSDALLGIFDGIATVAARALRALADGDLGAYHQILDPTVPLARHIFAPPTSSYKTGIVFLAYLNGHQARFEMVGGLEQARSREHLIELFGLAQAAGVLIDPASAAQRYHEWLEA